MSGHTYTHTHTHTHTHTYTHDNYYNPRCACAPRVNKESNVVTIEYNATHYNHSTDLAHLRITGRSRQTRVSKLRKISITSKINLTLKVYKSIEMILLVFPPGLRKWKHWTIILCSI